MNVMRFVGRSSREAMRKVRDALGPDALVLANRPCAEGVELLVTAPGALAPLAVGAVDMPPSGGQLPDAEAAAGEPPPAAGMSTVSFQDYVRQRLRERGRAQGGSPASPAAASRSAPGMAFESTRASSREEAPAATRETPRRAAPEPAARHATDEAMRESMREAAREAVRGGARETGWPSEPPVFGHRAARGAAPAVGERSEASEALAFDATSRIDASVRIDAHAAAGFVGATHASAEPGRDALVAELQSLKSTISRQFSTMSWFEGVRRNPVQGRLLRTMVAAGFSLKLARSIVARLPSDYGEQDAPVWLEDVLARNLRCARAGEAFEAGGVYALVGPTGVGKTTTTAKIASRQVLKHGPQSVALITVDTYRLGAHDQLRAFGRILGVPVHVAHDASALHDLLRLRTSRQLVLIDTVGLGHRDERIGSLLMSLPRTDIRHVVVASSAAQAETVDQSLRVYEARQAAGVVLTKLDEAARLGGALDCLLRQRLQLLGVCDGQRVPEDWHAPEPAKLVRRALLAPPSGAFALDDEDLPLVFGVAATLQGDVAHA